MLPLRCLSSKCACAYTPEAERLREERREYKRYLQDCAAKAEAVAAEAAAASVAPAAATSPRAAAR